MKKSNHASGAHRAARVLSTGALFAGFFLCLVGPMPAGAIPIHPFADDEVIEVLPASADRTEERLARKKLEQQPRDPALALAVARRQLAKAHELGDPRFAGLASAAIAAWSDPAETPDDVLMMKASLQQYLHEFDASVATLGRLLGRPSPQPRPQAWLTLATVQRVQGRYAESDKACREVERSGAALHGAACLAENAALRGDVDAARATLARLLSQPGLPVATQSWLVTTVAELEQRDGKPAAADAAFRVVLQLDPDPYAMVGYADFLIEQKRPREALALLEHQPRTDAVLLRLAIAGAHAGTKDAARDAAEMRDRIALANERPDARTFHGREQAMFALAVDHRPALALELARGDVAHQREPLDLLVFAKAARASGDAGAISRARELKQRVGLHDRRIDALF